MARLGGDLQVSPQELMTDSSIQMAMLGTRATTGDGRYFRYVKCGGTALVPGKLYQGPATTTGWQALAIAAAAKGDVSITTTSTVTVTANQLAGGYVLVSTTPGLGYQYKISRHAAASGAVVTLYLEDPIQVALTTGTTIDLIASPFAEIELSDASNHDAAIVGVAVYPVTAEYYGWVQVAGPANVLADGTLVVGELAVASNGTDGAVEVAVGGSTEIQIPVGQCNTAVSTGEYGSVYLTIN